MSHLLSSVLALALQCEISPPAVAVVPPPLAPSDALEIVLVGPSSEADRLQDLLTVTAGRHRTLTWSRREGAPLDEMLAPSSADHPRLWVDLTPPTKIRLVLTVEQGDGVVLIRAVDDPLPRDPAAHLVAQETVAQIVEAFVSKGKTAEDAPSATAPPTMAQRPGEADSSDIISAAIEPQVSPTFPLWSMSGAAGPTYMPTSALVGGAYQLEVQRQAREASPALGVAIEVGPGRVALGAHFIGAAVFLARTWRRGRWLAEATAGAGVEALRSLSYNPGSQGQNAPTWTPSYDPALYLRATGAAGWALTSSVDLIARLTGHLGSSGWSNGFVGATVGLRVLLP